MWLRWYRFKAWFRRDRKVQREMRHELRHLIDEVEHR